MNWFVIQLRVLLALLVVSLCWADVQHLVAQQTPGKKLGQRPQTGRGANGASKPNTSKRPKAGQRPGLAKPNQLPGRKRGQNGGTNDRGQKPDGNRKPNKGKLNSGELNRLKAASPFLIVNTGVPTGATVKGFGKLLPEEQRTDFLRARRGRQVDNACVVTTETVELPEPEVKEGKPQIEGDYICTPMTVTETIANKDIYILGNLNKLYPGMVLDGVEFAKGQYVDSNDDRNPFSLAYANGPQLKGRSYVKVKKPGFDTVNAAHNQLIGQGVKGKTPANISFDVQKVYSSSHLNLQVGASVNYASASVASQFKVDWKKQSSRVLVTVKQVFYELHAERMDPDSVFVDRKATTSDAYVSRVGYGRLLMFLIESDASLEDLELAVQASFHAGITSGSAEVSGAYETILNESSIQVYAQGGSAEHVVEVINNGMPGISSYIEDGINFHPNSNPGSPMVFEVTYLKSGLTANVITSTSYQYSVCTLNTGRFNLTLKRIECTDTPFGNKHAKLYGSIKATAYLYDKGWSKVVHMEGTPYETTQVLDYRALDSVTEKIGSKSNPVFLEEGERHSMNKTLHAKYDNLQDVNLEKSYLMISFDLHEKDTAQKDAMEINSKKIYLSDIGVELGGGADLENAVEKTYKFNDKNNFDFKLIYTYGPG